MEAKKRVFAVTLTLIMIALPWTLYVLQSPGLQHGLMGELKSIIMGFWTGGSLGQQQVASDSKRKSLGVGPNLTSCHQSFGREDFPVYCCPPNDESLVPVVDYQFPDPSRPVRVRRAAHLVDADYIAKYQKAISIMRSLPHDDPRNFMRQANLHCLFCTAAYNQENSDTPLDIHGSWLFFPWHRMVLHFHERIIGSLIGDDTFALPYWPWDIPEGMVFPEMFMNGSFVDTERDKSHFPPQKVDLDYYSFERNLKSDEQISFNMAVMYNQMVSAAKKTELFMGCPLRPGEAGYCHAAGTMELAPHDTVHVWVGSNLNPGREDMGVFYSAARDPLFYPHHANIDRLWEVWREINQHKLDPTDPTWLNSYFFFYDENLRFVRIKVRDVLDMTKLGYVYEKTGVPWLNARPKPSVPPKLARQILSLRDNQNKLQMPSSHIISADFRPHGRHLHTSLTVKVNRPKILRTAREKREEEEVIVVHGINFRHDVYTKFDVYVNVVDETMISPQFREFAGTFAHVPGGVKYNNPARDEFMRRKPTLKLGISELLEDLEADSDEGIWVTLLPRTRSCVNATVDGIQIEYIR